jgi:hypothetical protein
MKLLPPARVGLLLVFILLASLAEARDCYTYQNSRLAIDWIHGVYCHGYGPGCVECLGDNQHCHGQVGVEWEICIDYQN